MSVILRQTPFTIHAAAYLAARQAYEAHRDECQVPLSSSDPLQCDYDDAYGPLVSAMHATASAAIRVPAASTAEIARKIEIMLKEDLHDDNRETIRELIECIGRDASRLGGVS